MVRGQDPSCARFRPSRLIKDHADEMVASSSGPIIDVASGYGRNALLLASMGAEVVCVDNDPAAISFIESDVKKVIRPRKYAKGLTTMLMDLREDAWPFRPRSVGGIVNVHFFHASLMSHFVNSIKKKGLLVVETISGHGDNYLELPPLGFILNSLGSAFDVLHYREAKVGPLKSNAARVHLVAAKR